MGTSGSCWATTSNSIDKCYNYKHRSPDECDAFLACDNAPAHSVRSSEDDIIVGFGRNIFMDFGDK
jgi:hypothetical protein